MDQSMERQTSPAPPGGGEVVLTYDPGAPSEVVLTYTAPLPEGLRPGAAAEAAPPPPPRRRRRRWKTAAVVLGCAVCLGLAALGVGFGLHMARRALQDRWSGPPYYQWDLPEDESPGQTAIAAYPTGGEARVEPLETHGEALTAQAVYQRVNPSVVAVVTYGENLAASGTGVIVSSDGYIVTNFHVVEGGEACFVLFYSGLQCEARLVGYDAESDLAVLKIEAVGLPVAEFGVSDDLQVGDRVYAIGNPLGVELRNTLTDGLVSAIDRDVDVEGVTMTLIQTNAALNSGNSGGPLINQYGQVVGINTIKMMSGDDTIEGLGFAIPTSLAVRWINDMIQYGEIQPQPVLGLSISVIPETLPDGGRGLEIISVTEGLSGDNAGILVGDYIVSFNGQEVSSTAEILAIRRELQVGDLVPVRIWRNGEYLDLTMEMMAETD